MRERNFLHPFQPYIFSRHKPTDNGTFQHDMEPLEERSEGDPNEIPIQQVTQQISKQLHRKRSKWTLIVTIVALVLIVVFVTVAYLVATTVNEKKKAEEDSCNTEVPCSNVLVETVPPDMTYKTGSIIHEKISDHWKQLTKIAVKEINILSFYWTMTVTDVPGVPAEKAKVGKEVLDGLFAAAKRGMCPNIFLKVSNTVK